MKIPTKKLRDGFEMPVYGFGTWKIGGNLKRDLSRNDDEEKKAIKKAIDKGVTYIDTAEAYAEGHAEELVGEVVEEMNRSELFLVSKAFMPVHAKYDGIIEACRNSLKRLKTNYLDLYLTHRYNPSDVSYKETMKAMDVLVDEGLVRFIGFSNYNLEDIKEAQSYAKHKLVAGQLHYNLQIREVERKGILQYCQENDIMLIAWRPLQENVLLHNPPEIVKAMMKKYNKTASQILINWLISQENVVTLSKTSNEKHLLENLGSLGWKMERNDIEKLRDEYPDQRDVSNFIPLDHE